jgi:hypothetical protein
MWKCPTILLFWRCTSPDSIAHDQGQKVNRSELVSFSLDAEKEKRCKAVATGCFEAMSILWDEMSLALAGT